MNSIHKINAINQKELEANVSDAASWHADYKDTSYIYVGNLHENLEEKDVLTIFSQFGNPTHINLIKNEDTGNSRGFGYLKYEDYRSCVLAVDNFNGVKVYERPLRVDHTYFKLIEGQNEDDFRVDYSQAEAEEPMKEKEKPKLLSYKPEVPNDDDFEDPMVSILGKKDSKRHHRHRHHLEKRHRSSKSQLESKPKSESPPSRTP